MISMQKRLAAVGADSVWQLQTVNGHWWKWQQSPSWKKNDCRWTPELPARFIVSSQSVRGAP